MIYELEKALKLKNASNELIEELKNYLPNENEHNFD